ncbi:MAG: hypothetical protein ACI8O8_001312 [Oleiphilaceae bacterium]|jgi:hypothetical protein
MIFWLLVSVSIMFGGLCMHNFLRIKQRDNNLKICRCLNKLERLKNLLNHIQRHRGLTSACLQGDQTVRVSVQSSLVSLDVQWRELTIAAPELLEDSLFEGIRSHWDSLKLRWENQLPKNNINQHNRLINNMLLLIENHAVQDIELSQISRSTGLDVIWKELLETIETIGQTRSIGVAMVAAKRSSPIDCIQLKFLIEKINRRLTELGCAFESDKIFVAKSYGIHMEWSKELVVTAKKNADVLSSFILNNLLSDRDISVSTEEFFELASDAIEPLDTIFDRTTELLIKLHSN